MPENPVLEKVKTIYRDIEGIYRYILNAAYLFLSYTRDIAVNNTLFICRAVR